MLPSYLNMIIYICSVTYVATYVAINLKKYCRMIFLKIYIFFHILSNGYNVTRLQEYFGYFF